jgi:H+/Cl- antiporter ClcA
MRIAHLLSFRHWQQHHALVLAGVAAIALVGDYTYFGQPQVTALASRVTPEVLVVSAACGLGGGLFSLLTLKSTQWLPLGLQRLRSERPGFLAGVTQAPVTSFVIVMEMTAQHAMVLPLMPTAAVATAVSKMVSKPLYQTLADRYAAIPEPVVLREPAVAPPTS